MSTSKEHKTPARHDYPDITEELIEELMREHLFGSTSLTCLECGVYIDPDQSHCVECGLNNPLYAYM